MTPCSGSSTSPVPVSASDTDLVGDQHHRLEPAQIAVGAPVLGELDAGARQLVGILLELGFEPLQQGEGVGGGAGEAGNHVALAEAAHLLGVALHDGLAEADLAVAGDHDLAALAHGHDRRGVHAVVIGHAGLLRFRAVPIGNRRGTSGGPALCMRMPRDCNDDCRQGRLALNGLVAARQSCRHVSKMLRNTD